MIAYHYLMPCWMTLSLDLMNTKNLRAMERVKLLPEPKEMSAAEWARHRVNHLAFHQGCKYCVGGRRPNTHHRASNSKRSIPLLCGDYGFLREITSDEVLTFWALYLKPWKAHMALPVDVKGHDAKTVQRLATWMRNCGLVHVAYRSDR